MFRAGFTREEKLLRETLSNLKINYGCDEFKVSTEDAGMSFDEIAEVYKLFGDIVPIFMKIGGPEARNDIANAIKIGVDGVIAPMVESCYALEKFIIASKEVCGDSVYKKLHKHINIETVNGCYDLNSILSSNYMRNISQITIGRTDLSRSVNKLVDSEEVFVLTKQIINKCKEHNIYVSVGGNITPLNSEKLAVELEPDKINTREVGLTVNNCKDIKKAIEEILIFEKAFLKYKIQSYYSKVNLLESRLTKLEKRMDN